MSLTKKIYLKNFSTEKNMVNFIFNKIINVNDSSKFINFVISGGSSTKSIIKNLHKLKINFVNWKFFLSDDRIIKNDNLRNDEFLKKNFFSKIIFKKKNFIHYKKKIISYKSLKEYKEKLKVKFFHLSILGFGNDGHVASIFSNAYKQDHSCYFIENSQVYPHKRVTMSLKLLNKSKEIMLIASRRNKKEMIKKIILKKKNLIVTKLKPQDKLYLFTYP